MLAAIGETRDLVRIAIAAAVVALVAVFLPPVFQAQAGHVGNDILNVVDLNADANVEAASIMSQYAYPEGARTVLLGRADVFADNLASGVLQGRGRPLLLTHSRTLSQATFNELERLGTREVQILGGRAAISDEVEQRLVEEGFGVTRLEGATRIETALSIASTTPSRTVLMTRAFGEEEETQAFADSLSAGAWAAETGFPIVMSERETLTGATRDWLMENGVETVFAVGGTAALSDDVLEEMRFLGIDVQRVGGQTRFETSLEVARNRGFDVPASSSQQFQSTEPFPVFLADGVDPDGWAPAFAAAGLAGGATDVSPGGPILLADDCFLPQPTEDTLAGGDGSRQLVFIPYVCEDAEHAAIELNGNFEPATIGLNNTETPPGGTISGTISGENIDGLAVAGCGLDPQNVAVGSDGSFSVLIPSSTPPGECDLSFGVSYTNGAGSSEVFTITVTEPETAPPPPPPPPEPTGPLSTSATIDESQSSFQSFSYSGAQINQPNDSHLNALDILEITFDRDMNTDATGLAITVRCKDNTESTYATTAENAGFTWETMRVLVVEIFSNEACGPLPAMVIGSQNITDTMGNPWDLPNSPDATFEDTSAPFVQSDTADNAETTFTVTFNETFTTMASQASAQDIGNYTVSDTAVTGATLLMDQRTVELTVNPALDCTNGAVTLNQTVTDDSGNQANQMGYTLVGDCTVT